MPTAEEDLEPLVAPRAVWSHDGRAGKTMVPTFTEGVAWVATLSEVGIIYENAGRIRRHGRRLNYTEKWARIGLILTRPYRYENSYTRI